MLNLGPLLCDIGCPPAEPASSILASAARFSLSPVVIGMQHNQL
jgi:hypothetical protein